MFTGIVEATGRVRAVRMAKGGIRLEVSGPFRVPRGASVAVSGVCLTAVSGLRFDVVPETLKRTTLGALRPGDRVNLERARPAGGRLDGHIVQGHVDGTGAVESMRRGRGGAVLAVRIPPGLAAGVAPKGSIAVDGVSLTVVDAEPDRFTVALVPYTLRHTTLGGLRRGDRVNIETDILAKYAGKARARSRITKAFLERAGFA